MIEQFYSFPCGAASASFGTVFTWNDRVDGMGIVPVVCIRTTSGHHDTHVATLSDPALVRSLIADLTAALGALEASL